MARWLYSTHPSAPTESAPAEAAWPLLTGIDAAEAVKNLGGDLDFFKALRRPFLTDNRHAPQAARRLLTAGETAKAAKLVRKLRGQAGHLGATTLRQAAGALEEAIDAEAPDVGDRLSSFESAHAEIFQTARGWLDHVEVFSELLIRLRRHATLRYLVILDVRRLSVSCEYKILATQWLVFR